MLKRALLILNNLTYLDYDFNKKICELTSSTDMSRKEAEIAVWMSLYSMPVCSA